MKRRAARFAFLLVVTGICAAPDASAFAPEPVVASPRIDLQPAVAAGYLAYSQSVAGHPNRFNLFVKPDGAARWRVNPAGTSAFAGSIDGTTLAYSQVSNARGQANIKLYNLVNRTLSNPPAGVNTRSHEAHPALSGSWLMFARSRVRSLSSPRRILLRNLNTDRQRLLDFGDDAYLQMGGLAGNYAVWTRCRRLNHCNTFLYEIGARVKRRLPNPFDRSQFAASVTADGTVYYAESGSILCGRRKIVRFFREPLDGPRERLATLARGSDTGVTSPLVHVDGAVDLYFDRFNATCSTADILKVPIPAPAS
jgi:hypothetical protein